MHLARLHQALPAIDALGVAPDIGNMVREGAFEDLVVGIAQDAAAGAHEFGVRGIGLPPVPAVLGAPALHRKPPLALVAGVAAGRGADGLEGDRVAVDQQQVLRRRDVVLARRDGLLHRAGPHQLERGGHGGVLAIQQGPAQRGHMARRRHRLQLVMAAGQDRAVLGPPQGQGDRRRVLDADDRGAGLELLVAVRREVLVVVLGVDLLDEDILVVEIRRGDAPAQIAAAAGQHGRNPGDRAADHPAASQFEPGQIPGGGGGKAQMRIVGQKRAARGRTRRRRRPGVGRAGQSAAGEGRERIVGHRRALGIAGQVGEHGGVFGQRGDAGAGRVRQDVAQPVIVAEHQRGAGTQHLLLEMATELQPHQLDDRHRVGRLPRRHRRVEQEHLRCAAAQRLFVDLVEPGVDPRSIRLQRRASVIILRLHRLLSQAVEVEPPQQPVEAQGARAEHLRQPPLNGAAHHRHLPQPILRVGVAQAEIHVRVGLAEDMRHVSVVADDLHRRAEPVDPFGLVVIGQRLAGQEINQPDGQDHQNDQPGGDAQQPTKNLSHSVPLLCPHSTDARQAPRARRGFNLGEFAGGEKARHRARRRPRIRE